MKTRLDKKVSRHMEWQKATKHLDRLVDSCQSVKSRRGLGYGDFIGPNEVYEPNQQSIFDPTPEENFQIPVKYIKEGGMNAVSPPITGTFKPPSPFTDFDESNMTYGKKSNDLLVSDSDTNDFVSCSSSDMTSETNDFASCDSSDKSDTPKTSPKTTPKSTPKSAVYYPRVAAVESNSKTASFVDL